MLQQTIETKDPPECGGPRQYKETPERCVNHTPYPSECQAPPVDPAFEFLGDTVENALPEPEPLVCGQAWRRTVDPHTGGWRMIPMYCEHWAHRECEVCFGRRKDGLQGRIARAIENGLDIRFAELAEAADLLDKLDKDAYLRLPEGEQAGGLFYDENAVEPDDRIGIPITGDIFRIPEARWNSMSDPPKGKRISGGLGRDDTDEQRGADPGWEKAEIEQVTVTPLKDEAGKAKIEAAQNEAIKQTARLDPHTVAEVEACAIVRTNAFVEALKKRGITAGSRNMVEVWVHLDSIDWFKSLWDDERDRDLNPGDGGNDPPGGGNGRY